MHIQAINSELLLVTQSSLSQCHSPSHTLSVSGSDFLRSQIRGTNLLVQSNKLCLCYIGMLQLIYFVNNNWGIGTNI